MLKTSLTPLCPTELSLYDDALATPAEIENECTRLRVAYPNIQREFLVVLIQRVVAKGFTKGRLIDSIDNLIDNFKYPHPTVADVISWDRKIKLYSHQEVVDGLSTGWTFDKYEMIDINGEKRWIRK